MRLKKTVATFSVAMAGLFISSAGQATMYSLVDDFGTSVFQYSYGQFGTSQTLMTASPTCLGGAISCFYGNGGSNNPPLVAVNNSGSTYVLGVDLDLPTNYLLSHPGPDSQNPDTIISFIAPISSLYKISVSTARLDQTTNGNGVNFSVRTPTNSSVLSYYINNSTPYGQPFSGGTPTVFLNAGETLDFVVNSAGEYTYDSTGLFGTIESLSSSAPVPEPTTWALMLTGIGALGIALRRKSGLSVRAARPA